VGDAVRLGDRLCLGAIAVLHRHQFRLMMNLETGNMDLLPKPSAHDGYANFR
jgi:hypothetical protein